MSIDLDCSAAAVHASCLLRQRASVASFEADSQQQQVLSNYCVTVAMSTRRHNHSSHQPLSHVSTAVRLIILTPTVPSLSLVIALGRRFSRPLFLVLSPTSAATSLPAVLDWFVTVCSGLSIPAEPPPSYFAESALSLLSTAPPLAAAPVLSTVIHPICPSAVL